MYGDKLCEGLIMRISARNQQAADVMIRVD